MPPKKNPLGDARKRLQEKIDSIKEQCDYIIQVLNTTVSNAIDPAVELLNQKERKKFFNKYSQVSQDLEKCLDFLLVLSDSVDNPRDGSYESGSNDDEGDSSYEQKDDKTKRKKDKEDGECEREVKEFESVKTITVQEEKPAIEEKTMKNQNTLSDNLGSNYSKTESDNKGASCASRSSDSTQSRKNQKTLQTSNQKPIQKQIKNGENQLHQTKSSVFDDNSQKMEVDTREGGAKTPQTSINSTSISPLQESAIKRFVPAQVKMPQAYREEQRKIDDKTSRKSTTQVSTLQPSLGGSQPDVSWAGRRSPAQGQKDRQTSTVQPSLGGSQTEVSRVGRMSPAQGQKGRQGKTLQPSLGGSQTDVSGAGRMSPAQGQKDRQTSTVQPSLGGSQTEVSRVGRMSPAQGQKDRQTSTVQPSLGGSQTEVSRVGRMSPAQGQKGRQGKTLQPSLGGSQTDVSGAGRMSPAQGQKDRQTSTVQPSLGGSQTEVSRVGRMSPAQGQKDRQTSTVQPSLGGSQTEVSRVGRMSPAQGQKGRQGKTLQPSLGGSQTDVSGAGRNLPAQGQKVVKAPRRESATKVFHVKQYPFTNGQCLEVVVTEVLSPWELWVQPTGSGFNLLMEKMCMQFAKAAASGYKGGLSSPPSVGEYCCARFAIDDTWYRARVVGLHQSEDPMKQTEGRRQRNSSSSSTSSLDNSYPGLEVEVLCIDDGNCERLPLSRLRPLDENLAVVPCQALCCALAGVKPVVQNTVKSQGDSVWKEEAIEWLKNKVSGTKLLAYPRKADEDPLIMVDLYFAPSGRKTSKTRGTDSTLPGLQYSIGNIMVIEGFAQRVDQVTTQPDDSKNTSPRSAFSDGVLSRSCSSISVASLPDCSMPVFEEDESPVTQSRSVTQDSPVITQAGAWPQGRSVIRESFATHGSAVTQRSDSKVEQNVIRRVSPSNTTVANQPQKTHSKALNQSVTQQQNSNHSKERSTKDPEFKPAVLQLTHNKEMDNVSENNIAVKRESPRHPPEGSSLTGPLDEQQDMDSMCPEDNKKRLYLPSQDQPLLLQVMMAEAVSPNEFFVHLVTPEAVLLSELTEDLDSYYKNSDVTSTPTDYRLSIGDYCCSKFTADNMWCRAQVIDVKISSSLGDGQESFCSQDSEAVRADILVFYIDYGNCEWVSMENTRPLLPKFTILPGFAVKCRLAGVKPVVIQDESTAILSNEAPSPQKPENSTAAKNAVVPTDVDTNQVTPNLPSKSTKPNPGGEDGGENRKEEQDGKEYKKEEQSLFKFTSAKHKGKSPKGRRGKKYQKIVLDKNVVQRAAGDESGDSELSDGLVFDWPEEEDERTKKKSEGESALPEKYLLPSPDQEPSEDIKLHDTRESIHHEWSEEAIELFKGLTGDDKPLRGVMVPWNARVYQQVYYPTASARDGSRIDITYKRPTLVLKLYDTTGEEDIAISQILVDTGLAELCEEEVQEVEEFFPVDEGERDEAKTVHISLVDLENTADQLEREGATISPVGSRCSSPDEEALNLWNPMMEDYVSSTNSYRIDKDDLDIALYGFKPIENQVCRFFQSTRSKCWRGQNCPFLHVKKGEDASMMVQAFCENSDFTVDLPELGSWVGVRVTAVLNPVHFWVQFPCGSGPIEKRIMEARLGLNVDDGKEKDEDEDEDFETMAEKMNKFYSRNLFRDSSSILPAMGELVVAQYSSNDAWYRARVTDVRDGEFQVYFVDYGNTEWTAERNVKRMLPQFLHIPFQAVECFLANVETIEENEEWSAEANEVFESLTQDKLLIAHVLSIACNNTMYLELYDTETNDEVNINVELVKQGFAVESTIRIYKPRQVKTVTARDEDSSDCEIIEMPG